MKGSALCGGKELPGKGGVRVQRTDAARQGQQCKGGSRRELETENVAQRGEPSGQLERNEARIMNGEQRKQK